jgi:hypothetical protein
MNYVRAELDQRDDETASSQSGSRLILGGYSYGSLIASCLPALELLSPLFQEAKQGSAESEIKQRAEQMGTDLVAYIEMQKNGSLGRGRSDKQALSATSSPSHGIAMGGYTPEAAARRVSRESSRRSLDTERFRKSVDRTRQRLMIRTKGDQELHTTSTPEEHPAAMMFEAEVAFLLISPILPPIAQFTTMFTKPTFERKDPLTHKTIAKDTSPRDEKFAVSPTCLIYGNKDVFTSASRTQKWVRRLSSRPGANIKYHEVDGAGHFWTEIDAPQQLQASIGSWLAELAQDHSSQR